MRTVLQLILRGAAAGESLARGVCVGHANTVHLDLPPPGKFCFQFVGNPITERRERKLLGQVALAPSRTGDDRPSQHKPQVLQQDHEQVLNPTNVKQF